MNQCEKQYVTGVISKILIKQFSLLIKKRRKICIFYLLHLVLLALNTLTPLYRHAAVNNK